MKLLVFTYHFLLSSLLPGILIFLVFGGALRFFMLALWALLWVVSYIYMDKFILFFLGAREIIDQDSQELFQQMKSETYKCFESQPKIYLYPGNAMKCFVLESRGEWSVVLDRYLVERMNREQTKALVNFLVRYKKAKVSWRLTKSYGLAAMVTGLNYSVWTKLFMLNPDSKPFKVLNFFTLAVLKPYVEAVLLAGKTSVRLECHMSLEPILNISSEMEPGLDFNDFLLENLQDKINLRDLLLQRLEGFPVIEKAVVKRSF